jgi:hypothetical protein
MVRCSDSFPACSSGRRQVCLKGIKDNQIPPGGAPGVNPVHHFHPDIKIQGFFNDKPDFIFGKNFLKTQSLYYPKAYIILSEGI